MHVVFGLHAVSAALRHQPDELLELWADRGRHDRRLEMLVREAQEQGVTVHRTARRELDQLAPPGARHQGVVARVQAPGLAPREDLLALVRQLPEPALVLALDGVQDPHNLGACLRSADGAGAHAVIAPKDRASGLTPTARKVASGAAETVPFYPVTNLVRTLEQLKQAGVWTVGLAGEADQDLYQVDLSGPVVLVLGAEGGGLRRLTRAACDWLVRIPMHGGVGSLNVSVAAGICLFEARRQRGAGAVG
ncbi:MAG: 23S rRNA (guanosine(2251)-2'-O)-methyltransferase RlmB [Gammaproteobacteria bacterium]